MSEKSAPSYQEQWMIGSNLNDHHLHHDHHEHIIDDEDENDEDDDHRNENYIVITSTVVRTRNNK